MATERAGLDAGLAGRPPGRRRWFVNAIGQTLAVVGPVESTTGSTNRRLAIATTETTLGHFRRFDPGHRARAERAHGSTPDDPEMPVGAVSFDEAARFCNWLSREEGSRPEDWCYIPGETPGAMVLAPDYPSPARLSTPHAARVGDTPPGRARPTDRYFGRSLRHAGAYAWYNRNTDNHAEPVGRKRPNDFGLFDALGNLLEWCYNPDPPHDRPVRLPGRPGRRVPQGPVRLRPRRELLPARRRPDGRGVQPDPRSPLPGRGAPLHRFPRRPDGALIRPDPRPMIPSTAHRVAAPKSSISNPQRTGDPHGQRDRCPQEDRPRGEPDRRLRELHLHLQHHGRLLPPPIVRLLGELLAARR